jgi:nitroimidazol reductase NimA-like FMN-containing flavoprotein (pyridoxamine 5'-phosphate oxidase superfamily)
MKHDEAIRCKVRDLLQQQLGVLSTVSEQAPYASLVAFAASADESRLFFITPRATRKFANMAANARVALLIHNSNNRLEDFQRAAAVTALGHAAPVPSKEQETARSYYLTKHPSLEAFACSPTNVIMELRVERYILVEHFQDVSEYRIAPDIPCGDKTGIR